MVLLCSVSPLEIVVVAGSKEVKKGFRTKSGAEKNVLNRLKSLQESLTLNRVPMEENFDCFDVSSGNGGKRFATNEHLEAFKRA